MRFSQLIAILEQGDAGVLEVSEGRNPLLQGAASLDCAQADQLAFLEKESCQLAQGYLNSKPLSLCDFLAFIKS